MKLYGSKPSPYVRRLRMFMIENKISHEFIELDIFEKSDRQTLASLSCIKKIPVLEHQALKLSDSGVIARYLTERFSLTPICWEKQETLSIIDACNDALVIQLIGSRSGLDTQSDTLLFKLQTERVTDTLVALEEIVAKGGIDSEHLDYVGVSLYCLIDWVMFRELADLTPYRTLLAFHAKHSTIDSAEQTDPRK